jgi:hypothetical protein
MTLDALLSSVIVQFRRAFCFDVLSKEERVKADEIKRIHDRIEIVAYRAFVEKVIELEIKEDSITEEQSGQILDHIKRQAHVEMFKKETGYTAQRNILLNPSQFEVLKQHVATIVHDRDTKLTDARYYSLTDLLMALDVHNTMVKQILFQSWYKSFPVIDSDHTHLEGIKKEVDFYPALDQQLLFNLRTHLKIRQIFWDTYFPGKRDASNTDSFINLIEVRHFALHLIKDNMQTDAKLITILSEKDVNTLFEPRFLFNKVRDREIEIPPLIKNRELTVGRFINEYFPEVESILNLDSRGNRGERSGIF